MNEGWLFEADAIPVREPPPTYKRLESSVWTQRKADLIRLYLELFVKVTFRGTYIDAFAGPQKFDDAWAARKLWESNPGAKRKRIDRFELFELKPTSFKKLQRMVNKTPVDGRKLFLQPGDCNVTVPARLLEKPVRGAAFCLLDQRAIECSWNLVETVARHKQTGRKIELFYFLMAKWKNRSLKNLRKNRKADLLHWWGRDDIELPVKANPQRLCELFTDRFRNELGYVHVNPFPIRASYAEGGTLQYWMIHASDHKDAPVLMRRAFCKVANIKDVTEHQTQIAWTDEELASFAKADNAKSAKSSGK